MERARLDGTAHSIIHHSVDPVPRYRVSKWRSVAVAETRWLVVCAVNGGKILAEQPANGGIDVCRIRVY